MHCISGKQLFVKLFDEINMMSAINEILKLLVQWEGVDNKRFDKYGKTVEFKIRGKITKNYLKQEGVDNGLKLAKCEKTKNVEERALKVNEKSEGVDGSCALDSLKI